MCRHAIPRFDLCPRRFAVNSSQVERRGQYAEGEEHYNPLGSVHGGYISTLLDSCMGCAVHTELGPGQGYTSLELKVNFVRRVSTETGSVRAEGKVIHVGGQVATAEGRLVDADGQLLAHGTTTCLVFRLPDGSK